MAWDYKHYSRDPELAKLEFDARGKRVGLWKEPNQIAPWEWRKNKRKKSG
ncbi:nuclease [bacterium]|nr:nuclease [bacterium]